MTAVSRAGRLLYPLEIPLLSRAAADRSEDLRALDRAAAGWPSALVLVVDAAGRTAVPKPLAGGPWGGPDGAPGDVALILRPAAECSAEPPENAALLGRIPDPTAPGGGPDVWAVPGEIGGPAADLRQLGPLLSDVDAGLLTTAVALLGWHGLGGFCPRCGEPSRPVNAGWARVCSRSHEEFPRTDPAVIVLVHDGADRMVLARQPIWPAGRVSVLAGFVEAGESLEATVEREILEEIGVAVVDIGYLGSQPWPFPRSLMVGFTARAEPDAVLVGHPGEIEDPHWVDRSTVRRMLAAGGAADGITLPGQLSIARRMIQGWAALD